ncbi:unnamed protein product, partial [Porites evermanni]
MRMDETTTITALGDGKHYKFLGVLENVRQDERLALACAAKEYLRRISIIWSSPLSDCNQGKVVTAAKAGNLLKQSQGKQFLEIVKDKKWQGKLFRIRWEDESLSITSCFAWLQGWSTCPTYTIAGMLCGKVAESVAHVLAGCSSLAQTKYLYRHNAALKILFFELLRGHGLIEEVPPWYSPVKPKPAYQNTTSEAFWDIPFYAEHNEVRANRIDARLVSHERKEVCTIEISCPWIESRAKKDEEKTLKYGPMMWELKQRYNGYRVEQYNVIIDVLGGYSKHLK